MEHEEVEYKDTKEKDFAYNWVNHLFFWFICRCFVLWLLYWVDVMGCIRTGIRANRCRGSGNTLYKPKYK